MKNCFFLTHSSDDRHNQSEWYWPSTGSQGILISGAGALLPVHGAEADGGGDPHQGVSAEKSEDDSDDEGHDTAVGVGQLPVQDQGELGEHDDEHEVTTQHAES